MLNFMFSLSSFPASFKAKKNVESPSSNFNYNYYRSLNSATHFFVTLRLFFPFYVLSFMSERSRDVFLSHEISQMNLTVHESLFLFISKFYRSEFEY